MKKTVLLFCFLLHTLTYLSQANVGFENGNTSGWSFQQGNNTNSTNMSGCCTAATINYAIVTPGNDPNVSVIPRVSPGGGNFSLRLGKYTPSATATRATYTFNVGVKSIFTLRYALIMGFGNDSCHHAPYFNVILKDASNNPIPNMGVHVQPKGTICATGDTTFMQAGNFVYKNWSTISYDLTSYIGQSIKVEIVAGECTAGNHHSYAYVDFGIDSFTLNGNTITPGQNVLYICQNSTNNLCAPPGYSYLWTGQTATGQTTQCVNIASPGTYSVTMTQGDTTIHSFFHVLTVPVPVFTASITNNNSCTGVCDGSLTANTINAGTYNWNLTGPSSYSATNTSSFSVNTLCNGTYTLSAQEPGTQIACPATTVITIMGSASGPPNVNPLSQTITCTSLATLDANPVTTSLPYDYIWTGPGITGSSTSQTVTVAQPGTYTLVTSNTLTGCSITHTVNVISTTSVPNLSISITNGTSVNCGACIELSASFTGTTSANPVTYVWHAPTMPAFNTTQSIYVCTAGIYTLNVTYANGCTATATMQVNGGQSLLTATVVPTITNTCPYVNDGSIQTTISPVGTYTYSWTDSQNNVISLNPDIYNLPLGTYQLNVSDGTACVNYTYYITSTGVSCSSLSGHIFNDINNDCVNNVGDINLAGVTVMANPGNYFGISDVNGNYTILAPYGTYTLSQVQFPNNYIASNCVSSLTATINASAPQAANLNFSDTSLHVVDGKIYNINSPGIVPGFNGNYSLYIGRNSSVDFTGVAKFVKSPLLTYTTFNPAPLSINGDTAYFAVNTLTLNYPYQSISIGSNAPPSLPLSLAITACAYLTVNGLDTELNNNTYCYTRLSTGSFDPNDKSVSPAGIGAEGFITANDSVLTYLIRFQNTGTGPAVNVVIKDTLSQNLNAATFKMLSASHNYNIDVLPGNVLRWKFNNIMLPDSNTNEPQSHGFVQYSIKQKVANVPGTEIKNTAYIYFDFNEPVVTNTTLNTIAIPTSVFEIKTDADGLSVFPNPANDKLYVRTDGKHNQEISKIVVMDVLGKEVLQEAYKHELIISSLTEGVYFVKVIYINGVSTTKKIVVNR